MASSLIKVFVTGVTGYVGGSFVEFWLRSPSTLNKYSIRALVRSPTVAENDIRPLGIEPVIGSLDDYKLLIRETVAADIVLHFADSDHLPGIKAILEGLTEPRHPGTHSRTRPILIHTSGTGLLSDDAYGSKASDVIYHDTDIKLLASLAPEQLHRLIDLEILSPSLVGKVDAYIVAPPMIYGKGTGPGNQVTAQIPQQVRASIKCGQAVRVGAGLNIWNKVHVEDLSRFYLLLLARSQLEPQRGDALQPVDGQGRILVKLPKNLEGYWFVEDGEEFRFGDVAEVIAQEFLQRGINTTGTVRSTNVEEQEEVWEQKGVMGMSGNSRSRAVKAQEFLGWVPEQTLSVEEYVRSEVERQLFLQRQ
ncbi:hypothetical protein BG004_007499 [Podila humilis]|nr:hypothetical protein BG004_007499 [Podila humilis]